MPLPIDAVVPEVLSHLERSRRVVVSAPTGSGKTTGLPPALLGASWAAGGRIVMLEPRRVAARAVADHLARSRGERLGDTIGLTTRDDRRTSSRTRLEIVTEGVLTRRLQRQPDLPGVVAVVFDEFHERSVQADLGLAMTLDIADLRELRIVVMSATLETDRVAALLGGAPVVASDSRAHPVEVTYAPPAPGTAPEVAVADAILRAGPRGDVLAFLPGAREIRRAADLLAGVDGVVLPLFGALAAADQDRALRPDPHGRRRVILATDIAETSLTIDGVSIVVDSGLARSPRFDPRTGMDRLETVRISRASADQRSGRAGRTGPGRAIRLWEEHRRLDPTTPPEITITDPAGPLLAAAAWGGIDSLRLLDRPPEAARSSADSLLVSLGAVDDSGRITDAGRRLLEVPAHPRLGAMLVSARPEERSTAAAIAALIGERDILRGLSGPPPADVGSRLVVLDGGPPPPGTEVARGPLHRVRAEMKRLAAAVGGSGPTDPEVAGRLLGIAYPDRIAVRRGSGSYLTASGRGARLSEHDPLATERYLAIGPVDDRGADARIHLAAPIDDPRTLGIATTRSPEIGWEDGDVVSIERELLGAIELARRPHTADPAHVLGAVLDGIHLEGLGLLPWGDATRSLRSRVHLLHEHLGDPWPDMSDPALLADLETWLGPFLGSVRRRSDLARVDLGSAIRSRIGWDIVRSVDDLAPTHVEVPSGSRIRLGYDEPGALPVLAVKLQEMFGTTGSPSIADGRIPVVVHLLSPARRPLQVTTDLAGFWERGYPEVRKEMRGRYPKHPWPEDPTTAVPTSRTKQSRG